MSGESPTVRQLFVPVQPGPDEGDIDRTFVATARAISAICATRILLMIAVITGSGIWGWTVIDPSRERLYAAVSFSLVFLGPLTALYHRKG